MPKKKVSPLANQLRVMRLSRRLSQAELAEKAEISTLSVLRMENDSTGGREVLPKILAALEKYDAEQEE